MIKIKRGACDERKPPLVSLSNVLNEKSRIETIGLITQCHQYGGRDKCYRTNHSMKVKQNCNFINIISFILLILFYHLILSFVSIT